MYYQVIVLPSHQFSSSHAPDTPRTKVVLPRRQFSSTQLQSHQFSSSNSPDTPRTQVVVASSHLPTPQLLRVLKLYYQVASSHLPAPQLLRVLKLYYKVASSQLPAPQIAPRTKVVLETRQFSASSSTAASSSTDSSAYKVALQSRQFSASSSPATPRTTVALQSRQFSSSSSPASPRTKVALQSHQFSSSNSPDTPRTKVDKVASSHLPTPQLLRVLTLYYPVASSHLPAPRLLRVLKFSEYTSRLPFARSTRPISAEGCARTDSIALSPAFRPLDTHDLRRGLRAQPAHRTLASISRTRHARSPQRVARTWDESHSRLHFAHSTRTISAEGRARSRQIALSPAFRALDTHDLRRGSRAHRTNRALACISRTRRARSPQRVARTWDESHSRLHFAHSTCTISAEGCARSRQIALSPAFRALDTHDLRRGLHFRLTLFVPPSAFKREFIIKWGNVFH